MNTYLKHFNYLKYRDGSGVINFSGSGIVGYAAWVFLVVFVAILIAACTIKYSKVTTVQGHTASDKGVIKIYPSVSGVVTGVRKKNGDSVENGEELFAIRPYSEEPAALGNKGASSSLIENLTEKKRVTEQIAKVSKSSLAKTIVSLEMQRKELMEQISLVDAEYVEHNRSIERAKSNIDRHLVLTEKNFISKAALGSLEDILAEQKKSGYSLKRQKKELEIQLQVVSSQIEDNKIKMSIVHEQHKQDILGINSEVIGVSLRDKVIIRASSSGVIHNISTSEGDAIQQKPLAMLIPENSRIVGEALIPSRHIGFIRVGQKVRVRYLAYPFQKYGAFRAVVQNVSSLPAYENTSAEMAGDMYFKVQFDLEDQILSVAEESVGLMPGMSFYADIETDARLIAEWILEPLLSLKRYF